MSIQGRTTKKGWAIGIYGYLLVKLFFGCEMTGRLFLHEWAPNTWAQLQKCEFVSYLSEMIQFDNSILQVQTLGCS